MIKRFELLDQITVYASTTLTTDDVNVITLLYAPLIEADAYKLYMTLQSLLNRSSLTSQSLLHKEILDITGMDALKFANARLKLEAIGLLSTYKHESEYMFMLKSPLTAKRFLSDGVLGMYLYSIVGDSEFRRIQKLFQIPKVDKSNFTEITASFDDVFQSIDDIEIKNKDYILDRKINTGIKIKNYEFDFNLFETRIALTFLEGNRVTPKFKTFIINLAYAYGFNEEAMEEIYNKSLNNSGHFDYTLCSKKAREKYAELHESQLPKLASKLEEEMSEAEELFQTLPAKMLIETSTGSKVATSMDVEKVSKLYQEYSELPRSVINVCVAYAIKKCDGNVPVYSYFDTILKDWINKGIVTFKQAQEVVEKTNKTTTGRKRKPEEPEWLKDYVNKFEEGVEDL